MKVTNGKICGKRGGERAKDVLFVQIRSQGLGLWLYLGDSSKQDANLENADLPRLRRR